MAPLDSGPVCSMAPLGWEPLCGMAPLGWLACWSRAPLWSRAPWMRWLGIKEAPAGGTERRLRDGGQEMHRVRWLDIKEERVGGTERKFRHGDTRTKKMAEGKHERKMTNGFMTCTVGTAFGLPNGQSHRHGGPPICFNYSDERQSY